MKQEIISALTIDVEDGINILMRDLFGTEMLPTNRVVSNMEVLLDLFEQHEVRSTLFLLGEVAEAYPSLVKRMASYGHELGVHGYRHDQMFKLNPESAKADIYRAKSLIEDLTGQEVRGFRAPAFSIFKETSWALDVITELGFIYDSSIVPAAGKRYGWPEIGKEIHRLKLPGGGQLIEAPISVFRILGNDIPACGGGYLRYFPFALTRMAYKHINKTRPVIVYLHPYELDTLRYPDFFYKAKSTLPLKKRLPISMYRLNKSTVLGKMDKLLKAYSFKPLIEIITELENSGKLTEQLLKTNS